MAGASASPSIPTISPPTASNGENATPVRIFTIAYGADADPGVLEQISQASNATAYQATDATTIDSVVTAVVSNF